MAKISYTNKEDAEITATADINKVSAADMNEIKDSVNTLYDVIISSSNLTIADSADDFPSAVSGVRTLPDGASYLITSAIDFSGDRLVLAGDATIFGVSTSISRLTSTGLGASVPFITSTNGIRLENVDIYDVGVALSLNASATTSAIDWRDVNFTNVTTVGTINTYDNVIMDTVGFLDAGTLTFEGTFGTIAFNDTIFNTKSGDTMIAFDSGVTITRRFRVENSAFIISSGEIGISLPLAVTIPNQGYILNTVNFAGGGTYLSGVDNTSNKANFKDNVGIANSKSVSQYYMNGNVTETVISSTDTAVKVSGTTTSSSVTQKFTNTDNRATYTGSLTETFYVGASLSLTSGNNNRIGVYIAKNGTIINDSEIYATTGSGGSAESVFVQSLVELAENDYIEIFVENETSTSNITITDLNVIIRV